MRLEDCIRTGELTFSIEWQSLYKERKNIPLFSIYLIYLKDWKTLTNLHLLFNLKNCRKCIYKEEEKHIKGDFGTKRLQDETRRLQMVWITRLKLHIFSFVLLLLLAKTALPRIIFILRWRVQNWTINKRLEEDDGDCRRLHMDWHFLYIDTIRT